MMEGSSPSLFESRALKLWQLNSVNVHYTINIVAPKCDSTAPIVIVIICNKQSAIVYSKLETKVIDNIVGHGWDKTQQMNSNGVL